MTTIVMICYFDGLAQKIPAAIIGLIIDGLSIYLGADIIQYHMNYYY